MKFQVVSVFALLLGVAIPASATAKQQNVVRVVDFDRGNPIALTAFVSHQAPRQVATVWPVTLADVVRTLLHKNVVLGNFPAPPYGGKPPKGSVVTGRFAGKDIYFLP